MEPVNKPVCPPFIPLCLMDQVETMIESGRAPYPVERTLPVSGVLESCLDSKLQAHRRLDTPHLAVRYQPPHDPCSCRS